MFFTYTKICDEGIILNPYAWLGYDILLNLKIPSLGYEKYVKILKGLGAILEHDIHLWIQVAPLGTSVNANIT